LQSPFDEKRSLDDQYPGDKPDDAGTNRINKCARCRDRDQPSNHTVTHHAWVGLTGTYFPHPQSRHDCSCCLWPRPQLSVMPQLKRRLRSDSPWYPTMKLFRQRSRGDWSRPVDEVRREIEKETHQCGE